MFHSVGFLIICRRRKNKAYHYSSRIVFDVKEVFMLYSENIQYHINVYKFSYQLPTDIPYTLDGSRYGRVEYKSKAELLIPGWNFF